MQVLAKLVFLVVAVALAVLVFYVSWFWRLLLVPMIVILVVDVVGSLVKKKR